MIHSWVPGWFLVSTWGSEALWVSLKHSAQEVTPGADLTCPGFTAVCGSASSQNRRSGTSETHDPCNELLGLEKGHMEHLLFLLIHKVLSFLSFPACLQTGDFSFWASGSGDVCWARSRHSGMR